MSGGKTLYGSEMLESLEVKIDTMVTALADTVTALADQLTALGGINASVSQGVSALTIGASDNAKFTVDTPLVVNAIAYTEKLHFKVMANGVFRFKGSWSFNKWATGASQTADIGYSIDGGSTWVNIDHVACAEAIGGVISRNISIDIPINALTEIIFALKCSNLTYVKDITIKTGTFIGYDTVDIVNGSAFIAV